MKNVLFSTILLALIACTGTGNKETHNHTDGDDAHANHQAMDTPASKSKSPKTMAMNTVGDNHIHIEYSSPSMRGRVIFGGLVPFDEVWVTGAHKATTIAFQKDVMINDQSIPAGKYGFFTIPGRDQWTIIINNDWDMHLADNYNSSNDVIRLAVTPIVLNEPVESLTYEVTAIDDKTGEVAFSWADVKVAFTIVNQ